jgi:hypothetical protein
MQSDTITSNSLASSAVTEIQTGLATSGALATTDGKVDSLLSSVSTIGAALTTLAAKFTGITLLAAWIKRIVRSDAGDADMATANTEIGGTFDGTTDSLQAIRDRGDVAWLSGEGGGGGGSVSVTVLPSSSVADVRADGSCITLYKGEEIPITHSVYDQVEAPIDLTGRTLEFIVESLAGTDLFTDSTLTISGEFNNTFTTDATTSTLTGAVRECRWTLWDYTVGKVVLAQGRLSVKAAATADPPSP